MAWTDHLFVILAVMMFLPPTCIQVPCCCRDSVARHIISSRHLAGFPVGVHIHCLWDFISPPQCVSHKEMGQKEIQGNYKM